MVNIKARRKLSDLYKVGVEVRFGPGPDGPAGRTPPSGEGYFLDENGKPLPPGEDEIQVWVQPPSPLQREMAIRDAQAARAKALVKAKREADSVEHLTIMAFLADMSDETLIDYVIIQDTESRRHQAIREVLAEDEWTDMTAYQDAMRIYNEQMDDGSKTLEELQEDPEWVALMETDAKFGDQVAEREAQITESERESLRMRGRPNVEKKALEKRSELVGTQAFMFEYERQMLFYSVRDFEDQGVLFFSSATELANEDERLTTVLNEAMVRFIADSAEAKNLSGAVSGSASSGLPNAPATSAASTPEVVNA